MKIVQCDDVEWKRGLQHRGGTFHYRHLLNGTPGTLGNFQFNIGKLEGDFASPRHRHNFDQFRFQIEGTMNFDRNGKMSGRQRSAIFRKARPMGRKARRARPVTAVLQFGSASGSGYLSREEVYAGTEELKKFGTFEGGIFRRNDDVEGRRNTDGYQAIWEHVHGQRMEYPKPRYRDPIMVDPAHYEWLPVAGMPGVSQKPLGTLHRAAMRSDDREACTAARPIAPRRTQRLSGAVGHRASSTTTPYRPATPRCISTTARTAISWRATRRRSCGSCCPICPACRRSGRLRSKPPSRMPLPSLYRLGRQAARVECCARGDVWCRARRRRRIVQDVGVYAHQHVGDRAFAEIAGAVLGFALLCAGATALRNFIARRVIWHDGRRNPVRPA